MSMSENVFLALLENRGYQVKEENIKSLYEMVKGYEPMLEQVAAVKITVNEPVTKFAVKVEV